MVLIDAMAKPLASRDKTCAFLGRVDGRRGLHPTVPDVDVRGALKVPAACGVKGTLTVRSRAGSRVQGVRGGR